MKIDKKLLYVSIFSLSWALLIFFNKNAINSGVEALPYTIQGTFVNASILLIYNLFLRRREFKKIKFNHLKRLVLIGIFVGTAYILGFYGLKLSTSINYGFLIKSTLLFTTILAFIFLKEKFNSEKVILLFVFVIGVYFLTTGGKMIIPRIGDILTLITAFCYSSALIITKPLTKEIHSDIVSLGRIGFALLVLFLLIPILKVNPLEIKAGIYVLITGVFGAILAIFINKTITVSSASYLTMMSMSVPVIVALLSLIFLKEPMNIFQIIGGTLIIVSGVLTQKSKI
jgi:drug/metabolite transporter (DMT)-like permease